MNLFRLLAIAFSCLILANTAGAADLAEETKRILALHEKVLQAHRENNVSMMMEDASEDYVLVSRGEVLFPTLEARGDRFENYFAITTFDRYEDTVEPIVRISDDGTLAWLIARVNVSGRQMQDAEELPMEFISAWIELYEKRDGHWAQVGNVSNFKPD